MTLTYLAIDENRKCEPLFLAKSWRLINTSINILLYIIVLLLEEPHDKQDKRIDDKSGMKGILYHAVGVCDDVCYPLHFGIFRFEVLMFLQLFMQIITVPLFIIVVGILDYLRVSAEYVMIANP